MKTFQTCTVWLAVAAGSLFGAGKLPPASVPKWSVHEIVLHAAKEYANPYTQVNLQAVFNSPAGAQVTVRGFWDGGNTFKLRFTPTEEGRWTCITKSEDPGLNGWKGVIESGPPDSDSRGFLRRDPEHSHHWVWDKGTHLFLLGQTYYEILSNARAGDSWQTAIDQSARYGINKVRFRLHVKTCGNRDNPFPCVEPWTIDKDHLDLAQWRAADRVIQYMLRKRMVADLMPFDSSQAAFGSPEQDLRFLRYVIARYAAYPNVIWCLTNEFQRTGKSVEYLNSLGRTLHSEDPWLTAGKYLRGLSIHPLGGKGHGNYFLFGDQTWPVHIILQTGRYDPADPQLYEEMMNNRKFDMPIVDDEFGYMGDSLWRNAEGQRGPHAGGYSREKHRQALWSMYMAGAYASVGDKNLYADGRPYKSSIWHNQPEYGDVFALVHLFTSNGVEYWRMKPDPKSIVQGERVYSLSEPGKRYIFYSAIGGAFTVDLPAGSYRVSLYDPRTGDMHELAVNTGGRQTFKAPSGKDWAFYVAASTVSQIPQQTVRNLVYAHAGDDDLLLDLALPSTGNGPYPVVLWIHGGAWLGGSKGERNPTARLPGMGIAVASINYRLIQQARFPAQIEDCKAAVRWIRANAGKYNLDANRIAVWGGSAGGHLAALLGTSGGVPQLEGDEGNLSYSSRVQAVIDFFGPTDLIALDQYNRRHKTNYNPQRTPEARLLGGPVREHSKLAALANPITFVSKDDPPFLILHGDLDTTIPPAQSERLAAALRKAGVKVSYCRLPGLKHGFRTGPKIDPLVDAFLQKYLLSR